MLFSADTFRLTPAKDVGWPHLFSLVQWELVNVPRKWLHRLWDTFPARADSRAERLELLDDYLMLARLAKKEKNRLEGLVARGASITSLTGATREKALASQDYLDELTAEAGQLRARAEEVLEAELSSVLRELGFSSGLGILFPPVDVRFEQPPTVLIVSPRDRIELQEAVLMDPDLHGLERDRLEKEMLELYGLSALVDNLGGIATYPAVVPDTDTTRSLVQTAAHEWLHQYLFFKPLGRNYYSSEIMSTLNETVADLAGREIGDNVFAGMGGDLTISASRYRAGEDRDPRFTEEMRKTRRRVDELLAEGMIEEAEQYMKERLWFFRLRGYRLRKLNQAFFAFRTRYAQSSVSVSPIGAQVKALRTALPTVGVFIETVAQVGSHERFLALLDRLDVRIESDETATTTPSS